LTSPERYEALPEGRKNATANAEAICEDVTRTTMRLVETKRPEQ
jgi:hypothetical protein